MAWRFLSNLRNHLHLTARRRADRLIFEQQERVALAMGYPSGGAGVDCAASGLATAAAMTTSATSLKSRNIKSRRAAMLGPHARSNDKK